MRLFKAGEDLGIKPFGIRAMDAMRLEKSYRLVGTEMSIEYSAYESGCIVLSARRKMVISLVVLGLKNGKQRGR